MSKQEEKNTVDEDTVENINNGAETTEEQDVNEQVVEEQTTEEVLEAELKQEKDKFLRLFAEFENYKRRTSKERIELFSTASEDVMKTMLPILDDFERALNHIENDKEAEELRKGVVLIYQKLVSTLQQKGLKVIPVEQGDTFNADEHEAITQIPAPSDDLKGKIIDVVVKGYKLGEKVIRYPKVVTGQ
ncbi:nucleotide exchange factor GrpE [Mariniflexile ostreae]|uniref:Protein GrpE n=1 Tax=Mariniflexile ostreae TaxID=1520892 RepID=A0ABV5FCF7_9FLAO